MGIKRAEEYKHLYNSRRWRKLSTDFRIAHPFCEYCHDPSQCVDHKKPHKGNESLFFDESNLQALCFPCHNSVKFRIELGQVPGEDFVIDNRPDDDGLPLSPNHPWNK